MSERRRFELVRELGSGTFGTVYLADMVSLGGFRKRVALKMLNPQWEDGSDAGRRLRDEARLLGRLRHRHIVAVDDLVRLNGRWGVVMEYVPGVDLERLISGKRKQGVPIPFGPALEITAAIAEALRVAYDGGQGAESLKVVHRDIKPSNVLLTAEGDVKVLDFGIASASFVGREAKTERVRFGSVPYMSPERVLGEPEVPAGDIYALGCVLYELLAARRLGRAELGPDQQHVQVETALGELQAQRSAPASLIALLSDCLKYSVADRPSAAEVTRRVRQLEQEIDGVGLQSFAESSIPGLLSQVTQPTAHGVFSEEMPAKSGDNQTILLPMDVEAAPSRTPSQPAPVNRGVSIPVMLIATGLLGIVLTAGLGAMWLWSQSHHEEDPSTVLTQPDASPPEAPVENTAPLAAPPLVEDAADPEPALEGAEEPVPDPPEPEAVEDAPEPPVAKEQSPEPVRPSDSPVATSEPDDESPRLRAVKFVAPAGATTISASCGDVSGQGTGSVNLRHPPAGRCTVRTTVDGVETTTTLTVDRPDGFSCTLDGGALQCR